jgi:V/A-type H+-transporting ATPase subunit D
MQANEQVPTRSAMLQLREEQGIIHEAYDFLDEKRLLLAAELLGQLNQYEKLLDEYEKLNQRAEQALVATVRRHGLQGTQVYPGHYLENAEMLMTNSLFMGVNLMKTELKIPKDEELAEVCQPSPEAEQCRHFFLEMIKLAAIIAGVSGNLHRLLAEYRRTERRARALENVVIPEIARKLSDMSTRLEELEQEDIVRVHLKY